MTFKILTSDTNKIIYRSGVRSAETFYKNYRAEMGRKQDNLPVFPDRNITAPDSDDGETEENIDLTSPTDEERSNPTEPSSDETTHPPMVSPIEKNDHPELDTSELLDEEWVQKY